MLIAWARPADLSERALNAFSDVLDDDERDRAARFLNAADRVAFVSAHGILRFALSRIEALHPAAWRFGRTPTGRPIIAGSAHGGLRFSLTHARTIVACVVAHAGTVGIDAEEIAANEPDPLLVAESCSPHEAETIAAAAPALRARLFTNMWTRKEAAAKALDLAYDFQPRTLTFSHGAACTLAFTSVPSDQQHIITLAASIEAGTPAISQVDEGWVTFGPLSRDT